MFKGLLIFYLTLLFVSSDLVFTQAQVYEIRVIDQDSEEGVQSDLRIVDPDPAKIIHLPPTDENGYCRITEECKPAQSIRAEPRNKLYYEGKMRCDKISKFIRVSKKLYIKNLESNAQDFENNGEYAKAALVYNEIYVRAVAFDEELATNAQKKTIELMGKYLNVSEPTTYVAMQKKVVMSTSLKEEVKSFQEKNNIEVTGKLDYETLSSAAGDNITSYIYSEPNIQ